MEAWDASDIVIGRRRRSGPRWSRWQRCGHGKMAKELGIPKRQLYTWRAHSCGWSGQPRPEASKERDLERENQRLKPALATKVLEADFFKVCCAESRLDASQPAAVARLHLRGNPSDAGCKHTLASSPCAGWARSSRAGFYRHWQQREPRCGRDGIARRGCSEIVLAHRAQLRLSAGDARAAQPGLGGQPQAGRAADGARTTCWPAASAASCSPPTPATTCACI